MWRGVIEELEEENCLGGGFPIACYRHPDAVTYISEPGKLSQFAPDGEFFSYLFMIIYSKA